MDSCPSALTVGKRCMRKGWTFYWPPYSPPIFIKPDGTVIPHIVKNDCPYIVDPLMQSVSMPASPQVPRLSRKNAPAREDEAVQNPSTPAGENQAAQEPEVPVDVAAEDVKEDKLKDLLTKTEQLKADA